MYVYDPQSQPQVFRVIVDMVKWDRRKENREGILYRIPSADALVYDTTKSPMKIRNSEIFCYWAPHNRVGTYGLEVEDIDIIQDYDS